MPLLSTWLNLEPSYLAQLCTYTGATHGEETMHLSIIFLKLWIFEKKITFCTFFSWFDIYAKDTKFINDPSYTHRHMHRQIQIQFLHFTLFASFGIHAKDTNFIFGIPQTYPCTDTQTCTHMYRDIDTQIQIHTDTYMFVYIHKHTYTLICMWEI